MYLRGPDSYEAFKKLTSNWIDKIFLFHKTIHKALEPHVPLKHLLLTKSFDRDTLICTDNHWLNTQTHIQRHYWISILYSRSSLLENTHFISEIVSLGSHTKSLVFVFFFFRFISNVLIVLLNTIYKTHVRNDTNKHIHCQPMRIFNWYKCVFFWVK